MDDLMKRAARFLLDGLDAVSLLDASGKYLYANEKWLKLTNMVPQKIYNKYAWDVFPDTRAHVVLKTREPVVGHVVSAGKTKLFTSYYPILENDELYGVLVLVFMQGMENALNFSRMVASLQQELSDYKSRVDNLCNANYSINNIIGESIAVKRLKEQIFAAARTKSTVLIEGETGTGKELVAHSIHALSQRSSARMVRVNCAAIPEELMESEFFGYEAGAYTGARKGGKAGKFELANGGSIFFDEINQLPLPMQPKLLRVLQEREIERVGGNGILPINVRVISATNLPLEQLVKQNLFRQDLFYRLNIYKIIIPPLRERKEDIPLLVKSLIFKLNYQLNLNISKVEDDVIDLFYGYSWPGNIRELQNVLECAMNNANDDTLELSDFRELSKRMSSPQAAASSSKGVLLRQSLLQGLSDEQSQKLICEMLEKYAGNKREVAHRLGISRTVFYKKLKKYRMI